MAPRSRSKSVSRSRSRSRSRSGRPTRRKRSVSRSYSRSPKGAGRRRKSISRSRSRSRSRSYSRSRSRSPYDRKQRYGGRSRSRSRSPMSSRKRHVGSREAPPAGKCLGVFGLSLYTTEREVRDMFGKYGTVADCNIVHDHATGRSRGFAFLNMSAVNEAEDAKERLNGAELDGRRIRVDYSITQRPHTPTPGVYMGRPSTTGERERERSSSKRGYRGSNYNPRYDGSRSGGRDRRRSYSRSRSRSRSPSYRDRY